VNHVKASGAEVLASIAQEKATWSSQDSKRGWHMYYAPGTSSLIPAMLSLYNPTFMHAQTSCLFFF
jgi:hypothetical protein